MSPRVPYRTPPLASAQVKEYQISLFAKKDTTPSPPSCPSCFPVGELVPGAQAVGGQSEGHKLGLGPFLQYPWVRDPEPDSPSGCQCLLPVAARETYSTAEFGSGLWAGQAWDGAGWHLGCCLAGHHPGWPPRPSHPPCRRSTIPQPSPRIFPGLNE